MLAFVLPELPPEELTKARRRINALPAGTEQVSARWAALLLPLGETGARKALKRLKCSNARIDGAAVLVRECGEKTPDTRISMICACKPSVCWEDMTSIPCSS